MNKLDVLRDKLYEAGHDLTKISMYVYAMNEQKIRIKYVSKSLENLCNSMLELKSLLADYANESEEIKSEQLTL